jgi:hypothetical protein
MKAYPQPPTSTQNPPPLHHPSTQILSTITKGSEHSTFGDILKVQLHQPANNISTIAVGSSHNGRAASSTQTDRGGPHQSPPQAASPIQVIQVEEAFEDEVVEEEELLRVLHEIKQQFNTVKPGGSTSTESEQGLQRYHTLSASFTSKSRGKNLRLTRCNINTMTILYHHFRYITKFPTILHHLRHNQFTRLTPNSAS